MALETAKKLRIRTSILPQPGRACCLEQCRRRAGRASGTASLASECSAGVEPLVRLGARNELPFAIEAAATRRRIATSFALLRTSAIVIIPAIERAATAAAPLMDVGPRHARWNPFGSRVRGIRELDLDPAPEALRRVCACSAFPTRAEAEPCIIPGRPRLSNVEVCPIQLPGRESRMREPALTRMSLLDRCARPSRFAPISQVRSRFSVTAWALLSASNWRVGLSGMASRDRDISSSPRAARRNCGMIVRLLHTQPEPAFVEQVSARYGALPKVIADDPELMRLFMPTLRADLAVC